MNMYPVSVSAGQQPPAKPVHVQIPASLCEQINLVRSGKAMETGASCSFRRALCYVLEVGLETLGRGKL